jgi:enoyl-CoA hydratase
MPGSFLPPAKSGGYDDVEPERGHPPRHSGDGLASVTDAVLTRAEPGAVVLSLNSGPVNALDALGLETLRDALVELRSSPDGIVLTGIGRCFCAGFDLRALLAAEKAQPDAIAGLLEGYQALLIEMLTHPRPIIAALNGAAVAAGAILAYAADAAVAGTGAKVGLPELRLGLPLQPLSFEILRTSLGAAFPPLLIRGTPTLVRDIAASELAEVVTQDQVVPHAIATARRLASSNAATFALAKRQRWRPVLEAARASAETEIEVRSVWQRANLSEILQLIAAPASRVGASP